MSNDVEKIAKIIELLLAGLSGAAIVLTEAQNALGVLAKARAEGRDVTDEEVQAALDRAQAALDKLPKPATPG